MCEVHVPALPEHVLHSHLFALRTQRGILLCEANQLPPVMFNRAKMKEEKPKEKKPTRKGNTPIYVWVTPDEKAAIEEFARQTGRSTSGYLRMLGLGYEPRSIVDNDRVEELAKINGDLGRLGGLLKLWLTNDARTARFGEATIRAALARIEDTQDKMVGVIRSIVRPRAEK